MAMLRGGSGHIDDRGPVVFAPAMLAGVLVVALAVIKVKQIRTK
jgi:hypothetical protein